MKHTHKAWHLGSANRDQGWIEFSIIRMKSTLSLALLLVSANALAAPTWLECSGEQKILAGKPVYSGTIAVMFERETKKVHVRDGSNKFDAWDVSVSPVSIHATLFLRELFIDRDTSAFKLWRFAASYETQSTVTGTCRPLAQPPEK